MAEGGSQEKTESPSEKRRDDARNEGQVAFSKEVSGVALLGGFLLLFYFGGRSMLDGLASSFVYAFSNLKMAELDGPLVRSLFDRYVNDSARLVAPFFLTAIVLGILASVAQVGFRITGKPIMPKLSKISPLAGIKRLFSKQAFSELIKSLFKMGVIGYIGYYTFMENLDRLLNLMAGDSSRLLFESVDLVAIFTFRLFIAMLALAVLDYMFQRWDLEQKLKMSKQEVKEELKQAEGDPQLKARIRQIQQQMSQARTMQEVPKADVLVTNPTHFAVAMKYDREVMTAPQVVAKGTDYLALRMIEIAKENDVTIYESPTVARGLYFQVEVGQEIPEEFYKAIAEILAFVYKSKAKKKR